MRVKIGGGRLSLVRPDDYPANVTHLPEPEREPRVEHRLPLTASGIVPTYDTLYGGPAKRVYESRVLEAGLTEVDSAWWPCEERELSTDHAIMRDGDEIVYEFDDGVIAYVHLGHGDFRARVAANTRGNVSATLSAFRAAYPATYLGATENRIPMTFWALGPYGPTQRLRMIDAQPWIDIRGNYTAAVRERLDSMMSDFRPGRGGQLLLWQGEPGTGKTWALRALASEWASWAEFHCITDPDSFFVDSPIYMIDVLLADSYGAIDEPTGDVYEEPNEGKWRILILEDTGELLSAHAKEKYGQGLSRLLNVVDGMIGQGLRVLVLVTTNDELGELNPAVLRPGRCAAQVVFERLTQAEAAEWAGEDVDDVIGATLAELYDRRSKLADGESVDDPTAEIRDVAEAHAPDGGYGDTWWNPDTATVFWNHADWSSDDEIDAAHDAFLAVPGVENFETDSEVEGPDGDGWVEIWNETDAARNDEVAALAELARAPLEPS